jgi:hypothetical protein
MKKKLACFIISIVFIIGVSAGALAATNPEISAILNYGIKIEVNGTEFIPTDVDGSILLPITYNGRTYLPVRSLANALNVAVDYENNTVYLGERGRIPLTGEDYEKMYTSQFTTDKSLLLVNDKQYSSGIVYTGTAGSYEYSGFIYPNGQYQKFGGVACFQDDDGSTSEVIIKIRENDYQGNVLKEITLHSGETVAFEIDIPQVETLYIQNLTTDRVPKSTNPDIMMIAEPYFK